MSMLKNQQKGLKNVFNRSTSLLSRQQNFLTMKKNSISKLFDECAWQNIRIRELEVTHEQVLGQIHELQDTKKRIETLDRINKEHTAKLERLKIMVEHIENTYYGNLNGEESTPRISLSSIEDSALKELINKMLTFYNTFCQSINSSYKKFNEIQNEKKRKKNHYKELTANLNDRDIKKSDDESSNKNSGHIELTQIFLAFTSNCDFLIKAKNFVYFFGIRIHKMIDSVNKICRLLDVDYHLAILCPFTNDTYVPKPSTRPDMQSSVVSEDGEQLVNNNIALGYNWSDQHFMENSHEMARWVEVYFPCFGKYDPSSSFATFFLKFYENVVQHFGLLNSYLRRFNDERQEGFKQHNVVLPKFCRHKDKKGGLYESVLNRSVIDKKSLSQKIIKANFVARQSLSKISINTYKKSVPVKKTTDSIP